MPVMLSQFTEVSLLSIGVLVIMGIESLYNKVKWESNNFVKS